MARRIRINEDVRGIVLSSGLVLDDVRTFKWAAMNTTVNNFHIFCGGGPTGVGAALMMVIEA